MSERSQVWRVMQPRLKPYGRFKRIEYHVQAGLPDVNYTLLNPRGYQGWIENKVFDEIGKCPPHFTRDQIMWGKAEIAFGGSWHLFGRCGMHWLMYDVAEAIKLFEGEPSLPLFTISGRFPLRELLHNLAQPQSAS